MQTPPSDFVITDKYMDLKTDFGFKFTFGRPENKEFTLNFINSILPTSDLVEDLEFLPSEQIGSNIEARGAIFDILCLTKDGRQILIEMQRLPQRYFPERTLFYATWPIQSQSQKGPWNFKLNKVYVISIIDFTLQSSTENFLNHHKILNTQTHKEYTDTLEFVTLELPRFKKELKATKSLLERWTWLFIYLNKQQNHPEEQLEEIFEHLLERVEIIKFNKKDQEDYKVAVYNESMLKPFTDFMREESFAEGKEIGKKEGLAEGLNQATKQIAQKMRLDGMPLKKIAELSGLSIEEIKKV